MLLFNFLFIKNHEKVSDVQKKSSLLINQHIMIFKDHLALNYAENLGLITGINYILKYITKENISVFLIK